MPKFARAPKDIIIEDLLGEFFHARDTLSKKVGSSLTDVREEILVTMPGGSRNRTTVGGLYADLLVHFVAARGPKVVKEFHEFVEDFLDENVAIGRRANPAPLRSRR